MQLRQRCDEAGAVRRFIQVLRLHSEFPATAIARALQRALALACFSVDGVRHTCLKSANVELMKT